MTNKSLTVAKTNITNVKLAYMYTLIPLGIVTLQDIVYIILYQFDIFPGAESANAATGNYLYLFLIVSAIVIPSMHFHRFMNLGGKRKDFFMGNALTYVIMAAVISVIGVILYFTYEKMVLTYYSGETLNTLYVFGWIQHGAVIAFFQQFAFLLLLAVSIHTLTAIQGKWYGWVTDAVIVAVISVFTPIAPLRSALVWFFNLIIFNSNILMQIGACLVLSAVIYSLNQAIFARKAI